MPVLLFIRAHWRGLLGLLVLVLVFALGAWTGTRLVKPPPPEVHEVVKTVTAAAEVKAEEKHEAEVKTRTVTVFRDRMVLPDGTVQEHTERHSDSGSVAHVDERAESVRVETREVQVEKRVEVPAPLPKWRVGALVGVDLTHPPLLSDGRVGVGAIVERRLVGPISVGAYGTHTGSAGLLLTVEF
jgi:hypothetical protein